jgi:hypothetical protein
MDNFQKYFNELKKFCKKNNIDKNLICITSSGVLSVLNIRDCNDLDIFVNKKYKEIFKKYKCDIHNKYTKEGYYSHHFNDIINNSNYHFIIDDFKFCNLELIQEMKEFRIKNKLFGENSIKKDLNDLKLIHEFNGKIYFIDSIEP